MHSISGALKQRAGLVKFLCGQSLIDRLSEYWPDFLLFNSSALSIYISSVIRNVIGKDPIYFLLKNQQLLSGELESLQNRYVDQGFMKTVHEHAFALTPTTFTSRSFQRPVTLTTVRTMTADIRALVAMAKTEILNTSEGFGAAINGFERLEGFAQSLVPQWTENFEIYRRTPDSEFAALQKRGEAELPLGSDFHKKWSAEIRIVHDFAVEVQAKISKLAPLFDCNIHDVYINYDSPLFQITTEIDDLSRFVPALFAPVVKEKEMRLDKSNLLAIETLHLLITAPAGYGKTSFCRIHAMRDALALGEKAANRVPVYVSLHSLATEKIHDRIFLELPESKNLIGATDYAHLHWTFYLDGLDEIADKDQRLSILSVAKKMIDEIPNARIIVTSRDYLGGSSLQWLTRVELAGLEEYEIALLARKWLDVPEDLESFFIQLEASRTFGRLMRVPLLATLVLAVFRKWKSLPTSKNTLYSTFIELLCGGWDYVKSVNRDSEYGRHEKISVLTRFAGILQFNKLRRGSEGHLRSAVADVIPNRLSVFDDLVGEMIEDGLIQRSGKDLMFGHLSFQEYLAAKELGDPSGERNNVVLLDFLRGDDWWREVLSFYVGAHNRPGETERWIRRAADKVEQSGIVCRPRERFLLSCIEDSCPGWEAKLIKHQFEFSQTREESS
jgi:hypothetical protein